MKKYSFLIAVILLMIFQSCSKEKDENLSVVEKQLIENTWKYQFAQTKSNATNNMWIDDTNSCAVGNEWVFKENGEFILYDLGELCNPTQPSINYYKWYLSSDESKFIYYDEGFSQYEYIEEIISLTSSELIFEHSAGDIDNSIVRIHFTSN